MRVVSVARALPPFRYSQEAIRAKLEEIWSDRPSVTSRLASLHENTRVRTRHLALPLEQYGRSRTFGEANDHWFRVSQELGQEALEGALEAAGLAPKDVDAIFAVSITGIASPSLDVRLANRMGLRSDIKRVPIFGLGCVAGAAGIARAADYVKAYPDQVAVLVSVELCSLTFQPQDTSVANLISSGLFGDGAAAVVVVGEERARRMGLEGLRILATRSVLYPDTEDVMGWTVSERGFDIVLSPAVPTIARERLAPDVDAFLQDHDLRRGDIATWVCHPGGPKVLSAMQAGLELSDRDVRHAWKVLEEQGNLSSTSVLMALHEALLEGAPRLGAPGLLLAMGPAFCSELVLFEWCSGNSAQPAASNSQFVQ
jgi:alkylresorcinol/alkylpyrone synthase